MFWPSTLLAQHLVGPAPCWPSTLGAGPKTKRESSFRAILILKNCVRLAGRGFARPTPFPIFYGICMVEHTCDARLPHINGNVVRIVFDCSTGRARICRCLPGPPRPPFHVVRYGTTGRQPDARARHYLAGLRRQTLSRTPVMLGCCRCKGNNRAPTRPQWGRNIHVSPQ